MDDYTTVACSACNQPIYLAKRKLELSTWVCPGCGATNQSIATQRPVSVGVAVPSRFGPHKRY